MAKHVTAAAKNPMKQVEGRPVEMTDDEAAAAILAGADGTILVFGAGGWVGPVSLACAVTAWRGRDGRQGQ